MATTTTNYGFDVPTSSDLVKNGATAISTLGQDLDTFLFRPFGVNSVINSAFEIWQRGTSFTSTGYTADRWYGSTPTNITISRQSTNDTTNLPNIQYCVRLARSAGSTAAVYPQVSNSFESVNTRAYVGKTITFSFYARRGANFSGASNQIFAYVQTGTGTDQNVYNGYTGEVNAVGSSAVTLTTTWQRFTYTGTIATNVTEMGVKIYALTSGTAGAEDWFEITGVQIEAGSQATPFQTYGGTIQGELAACQRYYYRQGVGGSQAYQSFGFGSATSTTTMDAPIKFAQTMRIAPTSLDFANLGVSADNSTIISVSSATFVSSETGQDTAMVRFAATGLTQFRPYGVYANNSATALLGFSAELQEMTMDNVTFIEVESFGEVVEHAIIDNGDGSFTSMLKEHYEAQQVEHLTEIITPDEA